MVVEVCVRNKDMGKTFTSVSNKLTVIISNKWFQLVLHVSLNLPFTITMDRFITQQSKNQAQIRTLFRGRIHKKQLLLHTLLEKKHIAVFIYGGDMSHLIARILLTWENETRQ